MLTLTTYVAHRHSLLIPAAFNEKANNIFATFSLQGTCVNFSLYLNLDIRDVTHLKNSNNSGYGDKQGIAKTQLLRQIPLNQTQD